MKLSLLSLAVLLFFAESFLAQNKPATAVGIVADVTGEWIDAVTRVPLKPLDYVFPGERIKPPQNSPVAASLVLAYSNVGIARPELNCPSQSHCPSIYVVPSQKAVPFVMKFYAFLIDLVPTETEKYNDAITRGGPGLEAAVLENSNSGLNLAPLLGAVTASEYRYEITPWEESKATKAATVSGKLGWRPPEVRLDSEIHLPNGLYRLRLFDAYGRPNGYFAVMLLVSSADYARYQKAFKCWETQIGASDPGNHAGLQALRAGLLIAITRDPSLLDEKQ